MTNKKLSIIEQQTVENKLNHTAMRLELVLKERYIEHWKNLSINDLHGEIWNDIKGWEGLYQISNFERVRSYCQGNKLLKHQRHAEGYRKVVLSKPICPKLIHRLMAEAFIPNPEKLPQVNHINGDRNDNRIINLEWCNRSHDLYHRNRILKHGGYEHYKGVDSPFSKQIVQKDTDGEIIKIWASQGDIQRETGFLQSVISRCCNGNNKSGISYGYKWELKKDI